MDTSPLRPVFLQTDRATRTISNSNEIARIPRVDESTTLGCSSAVLKNNGGEEEINERETRSFLEKKGGVRCGTPLGTVI